MLSIATAVMLSAVAAPAADEPARPQRQARAVVHIVRPAIIALGKDGGTEAEGAVVREGRERAPDGSEQRFSLVEFY